MPEYDASQVCLSGHLISSDFHAAPHLSQQFCERCGEPTITECQSCHESIRGTVYVPGMSVAKDSVPAYCRGCGEPYPWTQRRKQMAIELLMDNSDATAADKEDFKLSVDAISRETPEAVVAAGQIRRILSKLGKESAKIIRDILVKVASDTISKQLRDGL